LCGELGVTSASIGSGLVRRPSRAGGSMGRILRSLLSEDEEQQAIPDRQVARMYRACRLRRSRAALKALGRQPTVGELVEAVAMCRDYPFQRLQVLRTLLLDPCGPLLTAAREAGASTVDVALDALLANVVLDEERGRFVGGLNVLGLRIADIRQRLADCPVDADAIGAAFADIVRNAVETCGFIEPDVVRRALEGSTIERRFSADPVFVDDSITSGETYLAIATVHSLYHSASRPRLFAACTEHPGMVRAWRLPIHVGTGAAILTEGLPALLGSYWDVVDGRVRRVSFVQASTDVARERIQWKNQRIRRMLRDVSSNASPPPLFARIGSATRRRFLEHVLLERRFGASGIAETFEAELFYRYLAAESSVSGERIEIVAGAARAAREWLRAGTSQMPIGELNDIVTVVMQESCARWRAQHQAHAASLRASAALLRERYSASGDRGVRDGLPAPCESARDEPNVAMASV
jgi:hypothetical protein